MILNLITLATVKTQLGIPTLTTTYDDSITAMIPIVSNDLRRILNTNYDNYIYATISDESAEVYLNSGNFDSYVFSPVLTMGQVIYSPSFPEDTYIQSFDPATSIYTMSNDATAAGTYLYPTINISQQPTISKMIYYKISKMDITSANTETLSSVRYGNVSKSFADSEINKRYDYPDIFIKDLGRAFAVTG